MDVGYLCIQAYSSQNISNEYDIELACTLGFPLTVLGLLDMLTVWFGLIFTVFWPIMGDWVDEKFRTLSVILCLYCKFFMVFFSARSVVHFSPICLKCLKCSNSERRFKSSQTLCVTFLLLILPSWNYIEVSNCANKTDSFQNKLHAHI
jgi:hypothetical protein